MQMKEKPCVPLETGMTPLFVYRTKDLDSLLWNEKNINRKSGKTWLIVFNCQSENVVYLIWCEECKLQGVGRTLKMSKRLSNYYSHIKQKRRTCSSVNHFIDKHANNWKDVLRIMGIVKLTNPPRDKEERKFRLWQFEGYWQVKLGTVHPHGLNDINELKEWFQKFRNCKRS